MSESWHCLDCDAAASSDATESGLAQLSREFHEMSGHETRDGLPNGHASK